MKHILAFVLTIVVFHTVSAQQAPQQELYRTILSKDSLLFNIGFNTCNIRQLETLLSNSYEFYHDIGGKADKQKFLSDLKNNLCKDPSGFQSRRELLPRSTTVYPLYNKGKLYGAVQYGEHRFFEQEAGQPEKAASTARFTHLWLLENGDWKLSRALSYDHQDKAPPPTPSSIFDNNTAMELWLKEQQVPALGLGIIIHGILQQVKVFGSMKEGQPAAYNTIFNVASLTKPVTALLTLQLVSQGKWDLDEPLYKYWTDPDISQDPRHKKLTTRIVLSHQTGFPNWRWLTPDKKLAFAFDPGTKYQYSGEGFEYLRKALEHKFHKRLDQMADELLFRPLQMRDTKYTWYQSDSSRVALGYNTAGQAYPPERNKSANAADDLLTTIGDYGHFLAHILNGAGLSSRIFDEMVAHQVQTKDNKYFGLGFEIYDLGNGDYALSHGGADRGVQTIFFIVPKTGQGIVIFTNVDDGWKVYEKLLVHYLGETGRKIFDIEMK